jgi:fructose-1,6-bisphosphatase/inositol monophosphatase family enzyme
VGFLHEHLDFAIKLAKKAGKLLIDMQTRPEIISNIDVEGKGLITKADIASDKFLIEEIKQNFPRHSILTEETGLITGNEYKWIIDPLDGTNNYARGSREFSVSIGLKYRDRRIVGVVFAPALDDLYYTSFGEGAYYIHDSLIKQVKLPEKPLSPKFTMSFATDIDWHQFEIDRGSYSRHQSHRDRVFGIRHGSTHG